MQNLADIFGFANVEWLAGDLGVPPPFAARTRRGRTAFGDAIAFPGLINSHDHLEFNLYPPTGSPPYHDFVEWSRDVQAEHELIGAIEAVPRDIRVQFGVLKNLLWGVTAVADHGGTSDSRHALITVLASYRTLHSPELEPWGRLRLLAGSSPVVLHLAEGTTTASRERALTLLRANLLRRPVTGVHGVSLEPADFARLRALIWCPASNLFLFGQTADVQAAARHTKILFGTDSTLSAPGTLWDHLRQARGRLPDRDILASLTTVAADFWRLPASHQRDFVVARRRKADKWDAFFAVTPDDILMVVRDGKAVLLDAALAAAPPTGTSEIRWRNSKKYVDLPVETMAAALGNTSPKFDYAALMARYAGAPSTAKAWRAA